jgi:kynurenine formamidase
MDETDFLEILSHTRRWGRWGPDDERGAINLITAERTRRAALLVTEGRSISLSRPLSSRPDAFAQPPIDHYMRRLSRGDGTSGAAVDYLAVACHGQSVTHLDALCHVWNRDGMWNGWVPEETVGFFGASRGGVDRWADGIVGRGVLLDVAGHRELGYVDIDNPVTGDELADLVEKSDIEVEPGDIVLIYSGREKWEQANQRQWGVQVGGVDQRPGLHTSCLEFFYAVDCSVIIWDMMDARPNEYSVPYSTHAALYNQGVALLDNAYLEDLANECRQLNRSTFLTVISPLRLVGGTGSPVNPIAVL